YWPSSRVFLNPIYLDLTAILELPQAALGMPELLARTRALNQAPLVDYPEVARLKFAILRELAGVFDIERPAALDAFIAGGGEPLQQFAAFCALSEHFEGRPWMTWPIEYRHPASPAVARWTND